MKWFWDPLSIWGKTYKDNSALNVIIKAESKYLQQCNIFNQPVHFSSFSLTDFHDMAGQSLIRLFCKQCVVWVCTLLCGSFYSMLININPKNILPIPCDTHFKNHPLREKVQSIHLLKKDGHNFSINLNFFKKKRIKAILVWWNS